MLQKIFDVFFPKRCINCDKYGQNICSYCRNNFLHFQDQDLCHVCKSPILYSSHRSTHSGCSDSSRLTRVHVCLKYTDLVERVMIELKYKNFYEITSDLACIMCESIDLKMLKNSILVPIPLHVYKYNKRGFNQAELIAQKICQNLGNSELPMLPILTRTRNTRTQVGLTREDRLTNLKNAFEITPNIHLDQYLDKNIVLLDDIMTTGTTLEECADVLLNVGFKKVDAIVLARG